MEKLGHARVLADSTEKTPDKIKEAEEIQSLQSSKNCT